MSCLDLPFLSNSVLASHMLSYSCFSHAFLVLASHRLFCSCFSQTFLVITSHILFCSCFSHAFLFKLLADFSRKVLSSHLLSCSFISHTFLFLLLTCFSCSCFSHAFLLLLLTCFSALASHMLVCTSFACDFCSIMHGSVLSFTSSHTMPFYIPAQRGSQLSFESKHDLHLMHRSICVSFDVWRGNKFANIHITAERKKNSQ